MLQKKYKIVADYFGKEQLDSARGHNQHIIEIWATRDGTLEVEFESFREFERDNFLREIGAVKSKTYTEYYEIK